jgi:hypothetical protein
MKTAIIVAWLTAELLKLPGSRAPGETREEYAARVGEVVTALVEEARPFADGQGWTLTEHAATAGVIWYEETKFDKRIHSGEGHPVWHQDHGLAKCGMQLHKSGLVPQEVWEKLVGLGKDQTHLCAHYGLKVVAAQAKQCGVYYRQRADRARVAKTFASYGSGGKCVPTDSSWLRADRWVKIMATRPDNERRAHPGYRRAAPAEIPVEIQKSAAAVVASFGTVGGHGPGSKIVKDRWLLVVEKHAQGKVGVSVLVKE